MQTQEFHTVCGFDLLASTEQSTDVAGLFRQVVLQARKVWTGTSAISGKATLLHVYDCLSSTARLIQKKVSLKAALGEVYLVKKSTFLKRFWTPAMQQMFKVAQDMRSQVCQYVGCSITFFESEDKTLALRKMSLHPPVRLLKARDSRWLCSSKQIGDISSYSYDCSTLLSSDSTAECSTCRLKHVRMHLAKSVI